MRAAGLAATLSFLFVVACATQQGSSPRGAARNPGWLTRFINGGEVDGVASPAGGEGSARRTPSAHGDDARLRFFDVTSALSETTEAQVVQPGLLDQGYTLDSVDRWDHTQDPKHAIAKQDAPGGSKGDESLAAKATDPTAMLTQVQIQNVFVPKSIKADGYANQFIIQPVIPVVQRSWMPSRMVVRPTVPILTTPETGGSGIGDSTVLAPFVWDTEDKSATYGIGPAVILPTATDDRTGEGQWQGGPAAVYIYKGIKGIQVGGVVYNVWDMWGDNDRKAINKLYAQAILNVHWGEGWYVGLGDFLYSVDWLNGDQVTAPVSVKLGKVVQIGKSKYNIFIAPFYTAEHGDAGPLWGIKLNITLLLPGVHL